jgi:hypothetical protein
MRSSANDTCRRSRMRLLIVRREDVGLHQRLKKEFADEPTVEIIADRRGAERRQTSLGHEPERRRSDRRCDNQSVTLALGSVGWAEVVRTSGSE